MLFNDYYNAVCDLCIVDVDDTWCSFLRPQYRYLLEKNKLTPDIVEDYTLTYPELDQMLKLEVDMRIALTDKRKVVSEWIYEVINKVIDPSVEVEEAELINSVVSLMRTNAQNKEDKGADKFLKVINFAKRETSEPKN